MNDRNRAMAHCEVTLYLMQPLVQKTFCFVLLYMSGLMSQSTFLVAALHALLQRSHCYTGIYASNAVVITM